MMDSLETLRARFLGDRFATEAAGITIESADEQHVICSMPITPLHRNAAGAVMGGAIFTLADFTFAVAANGNANEPAVTQTLNAQVSFLSSARGNRLYAESSCVKSGRTVCCYNIAITDTAHRTVAQVICTGIRVPKDPA